MKLVAVGGERGGGVTVEWCGLVLGRGGLLQEKRQRGRAKRQNQKEKAKMGLYVSFVVIFLAFFKKEAVQS